jgi:hypothetical protein
MSFEDRVENGAIVLDGAVALPEGTRVQVAVVESDVMNADATGTNEAATLHERLQSLVGRAKGLPSDFAAQHDHCCTPKR